MGYSGYLVKLGTAETELPFSYIRTASYKITPSQRLDLDSYRDSEGVLHRTTLAHTASKIEWETPPLTNTQVQAMLTLFINAMSSTSERKIDIEYYSQETDTYVTGTFYMPDIQFTIRSASSSEMWYEPIRIALIEY